MKHQFLLLLAVLLLCPLLAQAATQAQLTTEMVTRAGPGYEYPQELGVWPQSTPIVVVAVVTDNNGVQWAHVLFTDDEGDLYMSYTELSRMQTYSAWDEEPYRGADAVMIEDATVYLGPGDDYVARAEAIPKNACVSLCAYSDGYALIEYVENGLFVRGYVEESTVMTEREREMSFE